MKVEIGELELLVVVDALETCLTVVTPAHDADAENLRVMERVYQGLLNIKKKSGFDLEESVTSKFACPKCGYVESYTTKGKQNVEA